MFSMRRPSDELYYSVRLMFSIADLQQEAEQEEFEQESEDEEPPSQIYPIRCSVSVTKVRSFSIFPSLVFNVFFP